MKFMWKYNQAVNYTKNLNRLVKLCLGVERFNVDIVFTINLEIVCTLNCVFF